MFNLSFPTLYNLCILPVLCNYISVWGSRNTSKIVTAQNKAMRNFLGVNTYTSNCCTIGDMGWIDISILIKLSMLRFWNRLMDLDHDRLVIKIYFNDLHRCKKNWCFEIKLVSEEINQTDQFTHLFIVKNKINRSLLSRQRAECLDLEIESGRLRSIEKNRICILCNDGPILYSIVVS